MLDALDSLQGFIDSGFACQQGVGDVEVAFFFGPNDRHEMQVALSAPAVREAGARLQAGDIALALGIGVFPQGENRQLRDIEANAHPQVTA